MRTYYGVFYPNQIEPAFVSDKLERVERFKQGTTQTLRSKVVIKKVRARNFTEARDLLNPQPQAVALD